jgi:anti-sigma-K factor RskA
MSTNPPANPSIPFPGTSGPRHPAPEDLVVFAMQLLAPQESAVITRHLESCAECRGELARVLSDLALCASTVELHAPPAESRERLIQQVAREKKIVPVSAQPAALQAAQPQPAQQPHIAAFGRSASILSIEDRPQKHTGRTLFAIAGWAIAAALAVAVTLQYKDRDALHTTLVFQAAALERLNVDATHSHQLMDALTDPRAIRVTLTAKPLPKAQPTGGVTYNPDKGSLIFLASNLDPLQTYKTYELWVIPTDGSPIPAGTFHPDDQGNASVIMPDLPKGVTAKAFGVTIEPDGGSQTPTLPIIMSGS